MNRIDIDSPGPVKSMKRKHKLTAYELALKRFQEKLQNRKKLNLNLKTRQKKTPKTYRSKNKAINNNKKIEKEKNITNEIFDVVNQEDETVSEGLSFIGSLTSSTSSFETVSSVGNLKSMRNYFTSDLPPYKAKSILGKELYESLYFEQKTRKNSATLSTNLTKKHIIDVFKDYSSWKFEEDNELEANLPKLFGYMRQPLLDNETYSIVEKDTFQSRFSDLTCNVFDGLDWENIVVGGGIVLSSLANYKSLPDIAFNENDIEIFIYGGNYNEIVNRIYDTVITNVNGHCEIIRTSTSLAILCEYPYRHIHISLKHYNNILDILLNFEIDCCALVYDGEDVFAIERSKRSIKKRYNLINHSLRTPIYESRLLKFATYGFCVIIPGLDRHLIDPEIYKKDPIELTGLALLIYYEKKMMTKMKIQPESWIPRNQCFDIFSKDIFSFFRILEYELIGKSRINVGDYIPSNLLNIISRDCKNLFLPWGPQWPISKIQKVLSYRQSLCMKQLNCNLYFSGWNNIFNEGVLLENVFLNGSNHYVSEIDELKDDELWYRPAYVEENLDRDFIYWLCDAVYREDIEAVKKILKKRKVIPSDIPFHGKFGKNVISYACLFGNNEIAELLIKKGIDINVPDKSTGLYPIHYAAYSGNDRLVKILIENGCDINQKSHIQKLTPLHIAVYYHHKEVLDLLLSFDNINVNAKDRLKRTPLFIASASNNMDAVQKLHQHSAIMDTTAMNEVKVSTIAAYCGHQEIKEYLLPHLNEAFLEPQTKKPDEIGSVTPFSVEMLSETSCFWIDQENNASLLHYAIIHADYNLVEFLVDLDKGTLRDMSDDIDELKKHISGVSLNIKDVFEQYPIMIVRQLLNKIEVNSQDKNEFSLDLLCQLKGFPTYEQFKGWSKIKEILDSSYKTEYRLYEAEVSFTENKVYVDRMRTMSEFVKQLHIQKEEEEKFYQQQEEELRMNSASVQNVTYEDNQIIEPELHVETEPEDTLTSSMTPSPKKLIIETQPTNPVKYFSSSPGFTFKSPFESNEDKKMLEAMKDLANSSPTVSLLSFLTVIDLLSPLFSPNKHRLIQNALKHDPKLTAIGLAYTEGQEVDLALNLGNYIKYVDKQDNNKAK